MPIKKKLTTWIKNPWRLILTCLNIIIFSLVLFIILFSYGGFYYKHSLSPGQKEMLPSILLLAVLITARHFIKTRKSHGRKTDRLIKLLDNKSWIALILLFLLIFGYYAMYKSSWNMSRDSFLYYVYLRSLFFDGDLHFTNDYIRIGGPTYSMNHETGYWKNPFAVGCSVLWTPFFLTGHLYALNSGFPADGYSELPYGNALNLAGLVYAWLGLVLLISLLQKYFGDAIALLTGMIIWFATPLTFYTHQQPASDSALSFFTASLFFYFFFKLVERSTTPRWMVLGIAAGLTMLVRPQNIIFLAAPFILLMNHLLKAIKEKSKKNYLNTAKWGSLLTIFTSVTFIPQMLVWQIMYRLPFTIPQGENWMEWGKPKIIEILFSTNHGLFTWTPVLILGLIGLPLFFKKEKTAFIGLASVLVMMIYVNSVPNDWWGGNAFGGRRFSSLLPVFAIGIASLTALAFKKKIYKSAIVLLTLFVILWNISLISLYSDKSIPHQGYVQVKHLLNLLVKRTGEIIAGLPENTSSVFFILTHKNACPSCRNISLDNKETLIETGAETPFLRNGWSAIKEDKEANKKVRTTVRSIASLHFYSGSKVEKLKIQLNLKPSSTVRLVVVVVNGVPQKSIELTPDVWQTAEAEIQGKYIQRGVNLLRLDCHKILIKKPRPILNSVAGEFLEVEWIKLLRR